MMGWGIEGITRLVEVTQVPVHVQADEAPWVARSTGVGVGELATHRSGDVVRVGAVPITLVHTRSHNFVFGLRTPEQWMAMFGG
jgi:hypothetical protein